MHNAIFVRITEFRKFLKRKRLDAISRAGNVPGCTGKSVANAPDIVINGIMFSEQGLTS